MPNAPETLTETASFDLNIVVPGADDDMSDSTAIIKAFTQKLTNRTKYLKTAIDELPPPDLTPYAAKNAANTFTQPNTFESTIETRTINVRGGGNVDVDGGIHADGTITSDSGVTAASLSTDGVMTAGEVRSTDGDILLPAAKRVKYSGVVTADYARISLLSIFGGTIESAELWTTAWDRIVSGAAVTTIRIPIRLPQEAELTYVSVTHKATALANSFRVVRREQSTWGSGSHGSEPWVMHDIDGGGAAASADIQISRSENSVGSPLVPSVDNGANDYQLEVVLGGAGSELYSIRLEWRDPGPRND